MRASDLNPKLRAQLIATGVLPTSTKRAQPKKDDTAERTFAFQCAAGKLPRVVAQSKLPKSAHPNDPKRQWVFDFVFRDHGVIVEVNGGIWIQGAHSHPVDVTRNMRKQNDAAAEGFVVLQFTPREVKSGHAIAFTEKVLRNLGWQP